MIDPVAATGFLLAILATAAWLRERHQRRQHENTQKTEQERFSELLERLGIGHWIRDLDSGQMWWSSEFRRMHGIDDQVIPDRSRLMPHIHEDDRQKMPDHLLQAYAAGHGEFRYRSISSSGDVKHHLIRIAVSTSAQGKRVAYGFNLELTQQVQLQQQLAERSAYLETIVKHLPMGLSVFDHNLKLRFWNHEFPEVLNLPAELIHEGVDFADLIRVPALRGEYGPGDVESLVQARRSLALKFERHRFERARPNGRTHLVIGEPILSKDQVIGFVTTYTDITEQKRARDRVQQTTDLLRTLLENIPAGISMVDRELRAIAWNQRLLEVLDLPARLFDQPVVTLESIFQYNIERGEYGPVSDPAELIKTMLERARKFEPHAFERVRPNGQFISIVGHPLSSGGFVTIYTDITEQKSREAEIKRLARSDPLTGLDNRGAFLIGLKQALAQNRRRNSPLAVLFIDMDRFKSINDSMGHETGDLVLIEIARRLKNRLRVSDLVARLGGDEFVVALTELEGEIDAGQVAAQLVSELSAPFTTASGDLHLSPSIGIAIRPQDATNDTELLRMADLAMYHAKNAGGAGFRFYAPAMNDAVMQRIDFERRLREAVQNDALELHYQPIHGLTDGLPLLGFEALLRWPQPDGRAIAPDVFIPAAEGTDLIKLLGLWVCRSVAQQLSLWKRVHRPLAQASWRISINLSARQFEQPDLAQTLERCFAEKGESLERITFEITEGAMMTDPAKAQEQLLALQRRGAQCAVDDFGTGYSSLSYLRQFAINTLKIDRSFIHSLGPEPDSQAIVTAAIGLAHQLGRTTVAEGVETHGQLNTLRLLGCDAVQGYLLSRPMPAHQVPGYLLRVSQGDHQPSVSDAA